jgi:hypothetical protein
LIGNPSLDIFFVNNIIKIDEKAERDRAPHLLRIRHGCVVPMCHDFQPQDIALQAGHRARHLNANGVNVLPLASTNAMQWAASPGVYNIPITHSFQVFTQSAPGEYDLLPTIYDYTYTYEYKNRSYIPSV